MTNREHILEHIPKLIAELDDESLYGIYIGLLPEHPEILAPTIIACKICPKRNEDECYVDYGECEKHIAAWMNMEAQPK